MKKPVKFAIKDFSLIPESDALVPVTRREVFYGFSCYETIKVSDGRMRFLGEHIERFYESAKILGLRHSLDPGEVKKSLEELVKANGLTQAFLKIQLIGGDPPLFYGFSSDLPRYPDTHYTDGVTVISWPGERLLPRAKSNCLLLNYIAFREAAARGAFEALLIDRDGCAVEGTRSNVFALRGGTLVTAGDEVLYGVTRKHILTAAETEGISTELEKIALKDLMEGVYEELFISSTSMGAIPVAVIDTVPLKKDFPVTALLNRRLREFYS